MSLDTKYRPLKFADVVGQEGTVGILKNLIKGSALFSKSYIFAGPSGTGKTTLARILARVMLCDHVSEEGDPCNQCPSCLAVIEGRSSHSYVEMDAANNSGVATVRQIVSNLGYKTFDGKDRRIYLLDEAHRLTKESMDALLKPMEDNIPGTNDKRLVCLFCTTEPEKIRDTIKARCLMFGVKEPSYESVRERLRFIAESEQMAYEEEALEIIYASGRGHIRDMVNGLERVSRVGDLTVDNARKQLGLETEALVYLMLYNLGDSLDTALDYMHEILHLTSPPSLYKTLAQVCLNSYKTTLGVEAGICSMDLKMAKAIGERYGESLLLLADRILDKIVRDKTALLCELVMAHRLLLSGSLPIVGHTPVAVPKKSSQPKVVAPEPPKASYQNSESFQIAGGSLATQFVNPSGRQEVSLDQESEVEEVVNPPNLSRLTTGDMASVWSIFDD